MKYIIINVIFFINLSFITAQNESKEETYVYKTYEDFFNRTNGLKRNYLHCFGSPDKFEYFVDGSKRGKKFDMKDSLGYYVAYESVKSIYTVTRCYFNNNSGQFDHVLGGSKNYFIGSTGTCVGVINYWGDGYAKSVTGDVLVCWYFARMEGDKLVFFKDIKEIIKNDSELSKQYDEEYVKTNNVRVGRENELKFGMKYLSLYLKKHNL